jgi:trimethylamine corrinoid protein
MEYIDLAEKSKKMILNANENEVATWVDEVLCRNDQHAIEDMLAGFSDGNRYMGEKFERGDLSIPELIHFSFIVKDVLEKIYGHSKLSSGEPLGKILIATVEGDIHDIGKIIIATGFKLAGFQVIDLGRDVAASKIVEEAKKQEVDIIATSALLTTTLMEQKKVERLLRQKGMKDQYKTLVGGAPCTPRWARKIGADGYAADVLEAVKTAKEMMGVVNREEKIL